MIYLLLSALCDVIWTVLLVRSKGLSDWGSYAAGVLFLIGSILLFKKACSTVSLSMAVVIWSGLTIMLTIVWDIYFLKTKVDTRTFFFMLLCIVSILGMNYYSKAKW